MNIPRNTVVADHAPSRTSFWRPAAVLSVAGFLALVTSVWAAPEEDAVRWLRDYIQIDTTNPPGNEAEGARYLADRLAEAGIEARLLQSPKGRTSLYAHLPATAPKTGGALVLMHHIDVVPANDDWTEPPFSGRIAKGKIWGRGAIDVKGLGVAQLAALVRLAREKTPRHRDLVYLAVADEETGGGEGAGWLVEAHPELFDGVDAVLNEGGANRVVLERLAWWGIEVAQKRPLWLVARAQGRGAHGSTPMTDSATHRLVQALARVAARPPIYRVDPVVRDYLGAMVAIEGGVMADLFEGIDNLVANGTIAQNLPPSWLAVLTDTVQVTRIETTDTINVIPADVAGYIDIRLLPSTDAEAMLEDLRQTLGPRVTVEVLLGAPELAPSPTDHPLFETLTEVLAVRGPTVPAVIAGVTDSRYFRARGIATYGFDPFALDPRDMKGVHAKNEAIPVRTYLRGVETMGRVVRAYVAADQ